MKETAPSEFFQTGSGTATVSTDQQTLDGVREQTFLKGVWIRNNDATNDLLIHTTQVSYPTASNSYSLEAGKEIHLPVEDPWNILVRGRGADVSYYWWGM
jgi:hypothetical protein